ncbi:MAG: hypothetical protein J6A56_05695 [Clostridia bacterium]|nr:hypothetical protein [Clostridia bacterium]
MILIEKTQIMNFEGAIRGARNPMNSWDRMDSSYDKDGNYILGPNDLDLAKRLCKAGSDHRKFIRQILVCVDITAPMYWWKEFDTYKVATVANSTSTMHKLCSKPFELTDFSHDQLSIDALAALSSFMNFLETKRLSYIETKDKADWYDLIQLLPSSYNQTRTVTMNYENLLNMYFARRNHKLLEWHTYCDWILSLPYTKELFLQGENPLDK